MKTLVSFMNGSLGRAARFVLGLTLIYAGLFSLQGGITGFAVAVVGLVPIAMGFWGRCLLEIVTPRARHA